jgi:hypothetical protein
MSYKTANLLWQYTVLLLCPISFCINVYKWRNDPDWTEHSITALANILIINLYQIEKYIYPGKFQKIFNRSLFESSKRKTPLSDDFIFKTEIGTLLLGALSIILRNSMPELAAACYIISLFSLVLVAIPVFSKGKQKHYVGIFSGFLLLLPFSAVALLRTLHIFGVGVLLRGMFGGSLASLFILFNVYKNYSYELRVQNKINLAKAN